MAGGGDPIVAAAPRAGGAMARLLLDQPAWVHRRVETIEVLSAEGCSRRMSVDFTVPAELREDLALPDTDQHLVPLATLRKAPLRNFDLRDEGGRVVPVLGREHNGVLAWAMLLSAATRAIDPGEGLRDDLVAELRRVAIGSPAEARSTLDRLERRPRRYQEHAILEDDATTRLLGTLADNYVLIGALASAGRRRVIKYGYDSYLTLTRGYLGLGSGGLGIQAPAAAGRAASYHLELELPEDLRSERALLVDRRDGQRLAEDHEADRVAIYAPSIDPLAKPEAIVLLTPERAGFPSTALGIGVVTTVLLALGWLWGDLDPDGAGPPISLLLAASALFAGGVVRSGEHRMVQALLLGPRLALGTVALAALLSAATLAFGLSACTIEWCWGVSAVVSALATLVLGRFYAFCRPLVRGPE